MIQFKCNGHKEYFFMTMLLGEAEEENKIKKFSKLRKEVDFLMLKVLELFGGIGSYSAALGNRV